MELRQKLFKKISKSIYNNYKKDNYDQYRFDINEYKEYSILISIKLFLKKIISYRSSYFANNVIDKINHKLESINDVFLLFDEKSQKILIDIISFRLLGYKKIKIGATGSLYYYHLNKAKIELLPSDKIHKKMFQMDFILEKYSFEFNNKKIKMHFSKAGIAIDFYLEQYALKRKDLIVQAEVGDVVLDLGGCWGDTAIYFASKVGITGKVYSFEFIPGNVEIHKINTTLNSFIGNTVELVQNPVHENSDIPIYYDDNGPGSKIEFNQFEGFTGKTLTISIDDFVARRELSKIDFIKMDIEGSELSALKGAINTIKRFRPKLAIAIYHNAWDDLIDIPLYIKELDLNYDFHIDHFTLHQEETILFANPQ